jgi:hypothetical protein
MNNQTAKVCGQCKVGIVIYPKGEIYRLCTNPECSFYRPPDSVFVMNIKVAVCAETEEKAQDKVFARFKKGQEGSEKFTIAFGFPAKSKELTLWDALRKSSDMPILLLENDDER